MNGKYVMLGFSWIDKTYPPNFALTVIGFHAGTMKEALDTANDEKQKGENPIEHVGVFNFERDACFDDMIKWLMLKEVPKIYATVCISDLAKQIMDILKGVGDEQEIEQSES